MYTWSSGILAAVYYKSKAQRQDGSRNLCAVDMQLTGLARNESTIINTP